MAFRGRGGGRIIHHYHRHCRHQRYYYRDDMYSLTLVCEVIFILFALAINFYNKTSIYITDPLQNVKQNYLELQFGGTLIILFLMFFSNIFKDKPNKAWKMFLGVFITSIILVTSLFIGKFSMDLKYTEEKFEEMYSEYYLKKKTNFDGEKVYVADNLEKEGYIKIYKEECVKLYNSFSFKVYIGFMILMLVILLNILLMFKALKSKDNYEKIKKEDEVLFDETQNVKY